MKYYRIVRECGYCQGGTEIEYEKHDDDMTVAILEDIIEEGLWEWAEGKAHLPFGYGGNYTEDEFEDFYENNCCFGVEEITQEDYKKKGGYCHEN